ncbi:hypothetical protein BGM26_12570 [Bacillus sp. FJAT-29790]|uniref:hypothetical protein n=1 Tax=Bacillus sp. FJAT-29790 TaxID=1895002 RepID=UPI001C246210|nr:hypothetical protein [Bacillus sp. FJAT-29790]MBU8879823.1 hypothetical protein [Bacillus sp. FJAT-29790]
MDYLFLLGGSIVIITCFYFIVAPFFSGEGNTLAAVDGNELELPLEMIYATVNELEMDFLMKKISEDDFQTLKKRYQLLAADYMKMGNKGITDESKSKAEADEIEREILAELNKLRKQKGRIKE